MEFLVSRLRQGSSSTNTATHSKRPQCHRKAKKADPGSCPWVFPVLCEFNVFNALISNLYHERTSLRPRLRPTEKRDRNGLCLAGLRSPWTLTSGQSAATHEDSTSRDSYVSWSNSELSHCTAHPRHAPTNTQSLNDNITLRICSLIRCEMSTSATLASVVLLHLDWAPKLTQGPEGPSNGKTGAWQCKSVRALFKPGSQNVEALKGKSPPNETVWLPYKSAG